MEIGGEIVAELLLGSTITLISLLVGFNLGRNQTILSTDTKKQINRIFNKVVPKSEVGGVARPSAEQNYYRDNPEAATERDIMRETFNTLNNQ